MEDRQQPKHSMKSRMIFMLICFSIIFGAIFISKAIQKYLINRFIQSQSHVVTVSSIKVEYAYWQPKIRASGSIRAIKGINVTTELAGMVQKIYFTPGASVQVGDVLVQLNADAEIGLLQSLQASEKLAQITYDRDKKQYAIHAVSTQTLDTDIQNLKNFQAQVAQQMATVAKKTIRAPFTGRLGISAVNPGQYLNAGDKVVSLQMFDPIYADFYVPQQELVRLSVGQPVTVTADAFPDRSFTGKVTTIDPAIDITTRNIEVEGTIANPNNELTPGMFITAEVEIGNPEKYLTVPQTAISFNPYGDIIYVIRQKGTDQKGNPILIANQVFVVTGETRGDQITVLQGIKEGDEIVTTGQLKLRNGVQVAINNSVTPSNDPAPHVSNDHLNS